MPSGFLTGLRKFFADSAEIHERMALLNRPWEEKYLHWSGDTLHGHVVPPPGTRRSVTRGGWCPAADRTTS